MPSIFELAVCGDPGGLDMSDIDANDLGSGIHVRDVESSDACTRTEIEDSLGD
jgi:hypothetical protein